MPDLPSVMSAVDLQAWQNSPWFAGLAIWLGLGAAWFLAWRWKEIAGTTLFAVWVWAMAAIVGMSAALAAQIGWTASLSSKEAAILHYLAATLALAPGLALLGAKRPQSAMWQGVVVALLALAWIPAGIAYCVPSQPRLEVPIYLVVLEAVLACIVTANYIATRTAMPALLVGGSLLTMQSAWWWDIPEWRIPSGMIALVGCSMAALLLALPAVLEKKVEAVSVADRLWLDFRDAYGALWALRVAERVNALAELNGWQLRLHWAGFYRAEADDNDESESQEKLKPAENELAAAEKMLRSLLRRFVSPEWIAERTAKSEP